MLKKIILILILALAAVIFKTPLSCAEDILPVAVLSEEATLNPVSDVKLPLVLALRTRKSTFAAGEKIVFELVLTNVSGSALKVFNLDNKAVFCDINGTRWGTKDASGEMSVILSPGESIRKNFKVTGVNIPGKFNIGCSYGMGINEVNPEAAIAIDIVSK